MATQQSLSDKVMTKVGKAKAITAEAEDKVKIPSTAYKNVQGSFGIINGGNIQWEGCRDRFHSVSSPENIMEFVFCHNEGAGDDVVDFIRTIEEIIKLPEADRLQIKKTISKSVLWIRMSPWWKYKMRRSLLTALLRCGQNYKERTAACFEKALYSFYYTASTKKAIARFLDGHTAAALKKSTQFDGWYQFFYQKSDDAITKSLVKLRKKTPFDELCNAIRGQLDVSSTNWLKTMENRSAALKETVKAIKTQLKTAIQEAVKNKTYDVPALVESIRAQLEPVADKEQMEAIMGFVQAQAEQMKVLQQKAQEEVSEEPAIPAVAGE